MLISGSSALQFFGRVEYEESDLDLYVPYFHRDTVEAWILAQGYAAVSPKPSLSNLNLAEEEVQQTQPEHGPENYYASRGVSGVFTYTRPAKSNPEKEVKVQMIQLFPEKVS